MNILVLCTGNSARSILAEAILNRDGQERVHAWSAGSNPTGQVNPGAIRLLNRQGLDTSGYRSKSWDEFTAPGAPKMDLVVTVCSQAAGETCPIWPGAPLTAHWGIEDPANAPPDQIDLAFSAAYHRLNERIGAFLALPFERMDRGALAERVREIGERV